ncbi:hypothetical protein ABD87_15010 [Lysinibacillus sphaericus]|uniref:hypothetical protein n=1 Tax=Lysinibacillus sphaericus TaxID=1421 RepID=UPI0018CDB414|nr:hypothetical protein [Lysinibacillus sphaericus]MBG9730801.1 hypothetical protein [Lysinibacillus sphaericus]
MNTNTVFRMERDNKRICESLRGKKVKYGNSYDGVIEGISIDNKSIDISMLNNKGDVLGNITVSFDNFIERGEILSQ